MSQIEDERKPKKMKTRKTLTAPALACLLFINLLATVGTTHARTPEQLLMAPPANDNFANAQLLPGSNGTTSGNNTEATNEAGESAHGGIGAGKSVWFNWTASANGAASFNTFNSTFNTVLAVYTGSSMDGLSLVSFSNNAHNAQSIVSFQAAQGQNYKIVVAGLALGGNNFSAGDYTLSYSLGATPINDNFANATLLGTDFNNTFASTNFGATKEAGEPNHGGNGTRSVWFRFEGGTFGRSMTFKTAGSSFDTFLAVYTGASVNNLTQVAQNDNFGGTQQSQITFLAQASTTYYIVVDGILSSGETAFGNIVLSLATTRHKYASDYNLDGKTDLAVFRPSNGNWYFTLFNPGQFGVINWGISTDQPVPGDYDGDGRTDTAVTRTGIDNKKTWYIRQSKTGALMVVQWGLGDDVAVPGDYDTDGRTDVAVYRPSTNTWYLRTSTQLGFHSINFGQAGDIPVPGGYMDFTSRTSAAVFRPSTGTWYVTETSGNVVKAVQWGQNGDRPVQADYDGDGKTDFAVFRATAGAWYVLRSSNNQLQTAQLGSVVDTPQPGDYDGDGKADFAIYRAGTRTWTIIQSSDGQTRTEQFGLSSDLPVATLVGQ